tara:strand:- start:728 stop:856 length:129 start_codon:yes stop_codon:yes gene_type:complete
MVELSSNEWKKFWAIAGGLIFSLILIVFGIIVDYLGIFHTPK